MDDKNLHYILNNLNIVIDMPWVTLNEIKRLIAIPWLRLLFVLHGVRWGRGWYIYGMPIIQRYQGSTIQIGDYAALRSWRSSSPLSPKNPVILATRSPDAIIRIGDNAGLTATTIVAEELIDIGDRVAIGANSIIIDTDFHPLDYRSRLNDTSAGNHKPIVIEDEVFIGLNCLILKGVHIGKGAVIGGGSVVTGNIPPAVIAAGNPARIVRHLSEK